MFVDHSARLDRCGIEEAEVRIAIVLVRPPGTRTTNRVENREPCLLHRLPHWFRARLPVSTRPIPVGFEAEQTRVQPDSQCACGSVIDGPGGADEVRNTPLEKCLGEAGCQGDRSLLGAVGRYP